ncbi:MAG: hypothetical protein JNM95_09810 [Chitinophagaceae bacterium]|nr:hypothetical protein [Chitinophagaceae bacterium]
MLKFLIFLCTLSTLQIKAQIEVFISSGYQGSFNKTRFSGSFFSPSSTGSNYVNTNSIYYTSFGSGVYNSLGISAPIRKRICLSVEGFYNFYNPKLHEYKTSITSLEGTTTTQTNERIDFKNFLFLPSLSIKIGSFNNFTTCGKIGIVLPFLSSFHMERTSKTTSSSMSYTTSNLVYEIIPTYNIGSYLELTCSYSLTKHCKLHGFIRNINKSIEFKSARIQLYTQNGNSSLDNLQVYQKEFEYIKTKDEIVPSDPSKPTQLFSSTYSFSSLGMGLKLSYEISR